MLFRSGLILGNRKESVAQFSFLMVLAPILGKMVLDLMSGELAAQSIGTAPLLAGFAAAFVVGCLACKFMINIVKRGKLNWLPSTVRWSEGWPSSAIS